MAHLKKPRLLSGKRFPTLPFIFHPAQEEQEAIWRRGWEWFKEQFWERAMLSLHAGSPSPPPWQFHLRYKGRPAPQSRSDVTVVEKTNMYKYLFSASTRLGSIHSVSLIEGGRAGNMTINIHQIALPGMAQLVGYHFAK